jgi:hypothetical protein
MRGWEIRVDCCSVCGQRDVLGYPLQEEETLATIYWCSACIDEHSDKVTPFPPLKSDEDEDSDQEVAGNTKRQAELADHAVDAHPAFAQMESGPKRQRTGESTGKVECTTSMGNSPIHSTATAEGSCTGQAA